MTGTLLPTRKSWKSPFEQSPQPELRAGDRGCRAHPTMAVLMDTFEIRRKADAGDAEACNRLGEILLKEAPGELDGRVSESFLGDTLESLKRQRDGLNARANDAFDYEAFDALERWESELAAVDLAIRVREFGVERIVEQRHEHRLKSLREAFAYFERAALLGDPEGMWNCGWRFFLGEGVELSERNAILYWSGAAAKGHSGAAARLSELLSAESLGQYSPPEHRHSSVQPRRRLRVFLCHASEDKDAVRQLYQRLCADSFEPWLDEQALIAGQDWRQEVTAAVRQSDAVIACLSDVAVAKRGFVQKEIVTALEVADEQPEGTIYIIPVRLKECVVPNRLKRYHYVDLYSERGYEQLTAALRSQARRLES
jgi:TPR repeat protein